MQPLSELAVRHLLLRLRPINRALHDAVESQRLSAARLAQPELAALCVSDECVRHLLEEVSSARAGAHRPVAPAVLSPAEQGAEEDLRAQCEAIGARLPLDRLAERLQLSAFEQEAVLLCAAPELDRTYEKIYAFILDDLNRRFPCVELLVKLTAGSIEEQVLRRHALARSGRLRRARILSALGEAPTELRQELKLAADVFDFLTGAPLDLARLCRDPAEIAVPTGIQPPSGIGGKEFRRLAEALAAGCVRILGIWGPARHGGEELAVALAVAARRPPRRLLLPDPTHADAEAAALIDEEIKRATALRAYLLVDTDPLGDVQLQPLRRLLARELADAPVPVLLTGEQPWRPRAVLGCGAYAEIELARPDSQARLDLWSRNLPELEAEEIAALAARCDLSAGDIRALSGIARTRALLRDGHPEAACDDVAAAFTIVTRRGTSHFAAVIRPRRGPDDLVLPLNLHRQVSEIASFFELRSRVDEQWGFGRLSSGSGMRALFVGDPGTGKTLSAEVIAGLLGRDLYRVDLARITSKWVGETEKNLEAAFREAEESQAILFFDEADALFGKRGEVQHGTDRYANLEVSYLLQRLETCDGLVILASNVKDQIDLAFVRRFHAVIHFPRPGPAERWRIWRLALPSSAPLATGLDLDALARLDMTGASIVNAARTAALIAADSGCAAISMAHLVHATARQFRRESRILTPSELGAYGALLQEAP